MLKRKGIISYSAVLPGRVINDSDGTIAARTERTGADQVTLVMKAENGAFLVFSKGVDRGTLSVEGNTERPFRSSDGQLGHSIRASKATMFVVARAMEMQATTNLQIVAFGMTNPEETISELVGGITQNPGEVLLTDRQRAWRKLGVPLSAFKAVKEAYEYTAKWPAGPLAYSAMVFGATDILGEETIALPRTVVARLESKLGRELIIGLDPTKPRVRRLLAGPPTVTERRVVSPASPAFERRPLRSLPPEAVRRGLLEALRQRDTLAWSDEDLQLLSKWRENPHAWGI
jgi:hypothetical protein